MTRTYALLYSTTLIFSCPVFAENTDTYEVTSTALPSPETVGGHETTLTSQEIEEYQETFLKETLPYSPSVNVNGNGPVGRQVDFTIRGARSAQNLVLLDGIYLNNPASGGVVDLAHFLNADLDRIEVLPGPLTLAYGPGALGGVIQLIPKKGQGKPSIKSQAEAGSFQTKYGTITAQGEEGDLQFSGTIAGFDRGPSPFRNPLHGNLQGDRYRNGTLSSRVSYALTDNWEVEGLVRYFEGKVQFDEPRFDSVAHTFLPFEAKNFTNSKTLLTSFDNKWGNDDCEHSFKVAYSRIQQNTLMPSYQSTTLGEHPLLVYKLSYIITDQNTLMGGGEAGQERSKVGELHKRSHGGIFLIDTYQPFEGTSLKAGLRGDTYQSLGSRVTYSVGFDQKITPTTTVRASYGTNFKPPVLSDLFQTGPFIQANPLLKPEKSQSIEAGLDQTFFAEKVKVNMTGFLTTIDKVTLSRRVEDFKWQRYNGGQRKSKGVELALSLKPMKTLEIKGAFTLTHARNYPGDKKAPFIPLTKVAVGAHYNVLPELSFFVQGYGVSSRKDSVTRRNLAAYSLFNVGGAYDVYKTVSLYFRVDNLTNKRYDEVYGYGVRGRAYFIGLEAKT